MKTRSNKHARCKTPDEPLGGHASPGPRCVSVRLTAKAEPVSFSRCVCVFLGVKKNCYLIRRCGSVFSSLSTRSTRASTLCTQAFGGTQLSNDPSSGEASEATGQAGSCVHRNTAVSRGMKKKDAAERWLLRARQTQHLEVSRTRTPDKRHPN